MMYFNGFKVIYGKVLTQMLLICSVKSYEICRRKVTLLAGFVE
jgi:hypothetical protein